MLAVLAVGVGIGSATAIFTVINGVMLRPLPYPGGDRFVALYGAQTTVPGRYSSSTFPDLIEYQRRTTTSFDVFGWFEIRNHNLSSQGEPQCLAAVAVTPSLAHNLGVSPAVGPWFTDDSGVVISNRLWRRLGGSPSIVGTAVTLDGRRLTITGVMPSSFRLPIPGTRADPARDGPRGPLTDANSRPSGFQSWRSGFLDGARVEPDLRTDHAAVQVQARAIRVDPMRDRLCEHCAVARDSKRPDAAPPQIAYQHRFGDRLPVLDRQPKQPSAPEYGVAQGGSSALCVGAVRLPCALGVGAVLCGVVAVRGPP